VEAFDATGASTLPLWIGPLASPVKTVGGTGIRSCLPVWTAPTGDLITFDTRAVAGGNLFVGTNDGLFIFDAKGVTNCGGTPQTCAPLSTTARPVGLASPTVANGVVYLGSVRPARPSGVQSSGHTISASWISSSP
jgi:putative pyrroloquinoline-quinone-binding quinoprotein